MGSHNGGDKPRGRRVVPIPRAVIEAIVNAYYPRALSSPDTARARAQAGYTIASALAAAVIAVGVFSDIGQRSIFVQVLGLLAVATWIAAALFYQKAVAAPVEVIEAAQSSADDFVKRVLSNARDERTRVDDRHRWAGRISVVAASFTAAALIFGVVTQPHTAEPNLSLVWARSSEGEKLTSKIEIGQLPDGTSAETMLTVDLPGAPPRTLFRSQSMADSEGKVTASADIPLEGQPTSATLVCVVRKDGKELFKESLTLSPER